MGWGVVDTQASCTDNLKWCKKDKLQQRTHAFNVLIMSDTIAFSHFVRLVLKWYQVKPCAIKNLNVRDYIGYQETGN